MVRKAAKRIALGISGLKINGGKWKFCEALKFKISVK